MANLNVMTWGDPRAARICVAIHGITANAGSWSRPGRRLAELGWRVIAPDLRGHGESTRADGDFATAALIGDLLESAPSGPDVLIGHSFGGYLAQVVVLENAMRPRALILEDPVSHQPDRATPEAMLAWDEANLPRDIEGLRKLNPGWSRLDAAWKLVSLEQIAFADARAAFASNAPWDLRPRATEVARKQPTMWVLPEVSRFVPPEDQVRLKADVGEAAVTILRRRPQHPSRRPRAVCRHRPSDGGRQVSKADSAALPVAFLHPQPDEFSFVYRDGEPAVRIEPGQTLEVFTEDCFSGKLTAIDGKPREVAPFPRVNPLSGPIGIRGAAPGDILAIHFLSVRPARPWGVSTVSPNFGLLSGTRLTPNLQPELGERVWIWVVDEAQRTLRTMTRSGREIEAPLRPFHGSVGIAPAHGEVRNSVVPDAFGGNLDLPSLVEGTTLYLRVNAPEAKLWIGDGQFAQGDGEIAGTAVEGAMLTRLVTDVVRPADDIEWPRVETDDCIMVVGCARPLEDAARVASAGLVRWVADLCELALDDSLQLVSQSIRFRIGNLVNPVYSVAAILNKRQLPATKSILGDAHARLSKRKQI